MRHPVLLEGPGPTKNRQTLHSSARTHQGAPETHVGDGCCVEWTARSPSLLLLLTRGSLPRRPQLRPCPAVESWRSRNCWGLLCAERLHTHLAR